jgi:hypothetical protein
VYAGRLYKIVSQTRYLQYGIFVSSILVIGVGLLNVDKTVATTNRPTVNGEVDYGYIGRLSYDAAPEWENMLETVEVDELPLIESILIQEGALTGLPPACETELQGLATNTAVNRGKSIVCENLGRWKGEYMSKTTRSTN